MRIRALRPLAQADLSNNVVHFTERWGTENPQVPQRIRDLDARERLGSIMLQRRIHAFETFFTYGVPVVCFTEATREGMYALINGTTKRYVSWGIGFSKDFILQNGGGPAYYVRGDMWADFVASNLPDTIKALGTMFWPGVDLAPGENAPVTWMKKNEWAHEREWRVPFSGEGAGLAFQYRDVSTVVAPSTRAWLGLVKEIGAERDLAHVVVIDIPGPEKPRQAGSTPSEEDPYGDPDVRRLIGLDDD